MLENLLSKKLSSLKVTVGHDDLTVPYAGGEKIFCAIAEIFPQADIFTSMATKEWRERLKGRKVLTSFMQRIPFKRKLQRALFPFYPIAFESFNFTDYDLVISSSTRFAHGVITKPETKHICYMHSPGRMFWESEVYFGEGSKLKTLLSPALSYLRLWDRIAAQRVNQFIANSKNIAGKIKKYYGREAKIVHPFLDLERFKLNNRTTEPASAEALVNRQLNNYFLVVTRLAPWKRVDIAVRAAKRVGVRLKVVGGGSDKKRLQQMAHVEGKRSNVEILGSVSDEKLVELYRNCRAFIMTQEEDFGITSLEAQASGKPVIAYSAGGALETVVKGKTGEFFSPQAEEALAKVLRSFDPGKYDPETCRANAEKFSKERFQKQILETVKTVADS